MANESSICFNSNINVTFLSLETDIQDYNYQFYKYPIISKKTKLFNDFGTEYVNALPYIPQTDKNVNAYYFDVNKQSGGNFDIYRKTPDQKYYTYLFTASSYKTYDYNVKSGQYYHYLVSINGENGVINYSMLNPKTGEDEYYRRTFGNWTICNIEEYINDNNEVIYKKIGKTWNLGLNLENQSIIQNLSITAYDTIGKYPKISKGLRNYESSRFTGLLGLVKEYKSYSFIGQNEVNNLKSSMITNYTEKDEIFNSENFVDYESNLSDNAKYACEAWTVVNKYATEMDKLNAWKEFMDDGELKLIRDTKGNAWIAQITEPPEYTIDYISNVKETKVSFGWKEVATTENVSIISSDDLTEMR